MADDDMAMGAIDFSSRASMVREHFAHEPLVAVDTIGVQYGLAALPNSDRFGEIVQRKTFGMQESAFRFYEILGNERLGRMAIIARGDGVVARLLPAVVLVVHDMAILARCRIIRQIRRALTIPERVASGGEEEAEQYDERLFQCADPSYDGSRPDGFSGTNVCMPGGCSKEGRGCKWRFARVEAISVPNSAWHVRA